MVLCDHADTCEKECKGGLVDNFTNHKVPHEEKPVCRMPAGGGYCAKGAICKEVKNDTPR